MQSLGDLGQGGVEAGAPAHGVDRLEAAGGDEPCAGIGRHAVARPLFHGRGEGLVQRVFGKIEVSEKADQRRKHVPRFGAVDGFHSNARLRCGILCRRQSRAFVGSR